MSRTKPIALVAVLFALTVELLRASGPLLDAVAGELGTMVAAVIALGLFSLPGMLLVTLRRLSLPAIVLFLLLVRVTAQFVPALPVIGAGAVLAMAALGLAVQRAGDPVAATCGILAGGAIDLAIRSGTSTWDPIWLGVWGLPMVGLAVVGLWLALSVQVPERGTQLLGRIWCIGVYLALWTTTIGNPAVVASQSQLPLQVCLLVLLVTLVVAVELVRRMRLLGGSGQIPEPDSWFAGAAAGLVLLLGLGLAWWGSGAVALAGIVLTQVAAAVALARAVAIPGHSGSWAYGLAWVLPVLLYQLHYDMPLPFDNRLVIIAVAAPLALAAIGRRAADNAPISAPPAPEPMSGPVMSGPLRLVSPPLSAEALVSRALLLTLLVPVLILVTPPTRQAVEPSVSSIRLMTWNVKYGRDDVRGIVNPRQIADAIKAAKPDVVVLQEVSRGWTIGGGVDLAEFLARELGMSYRWGSAADHQFGNLLLTNRPLTNVEVGQLPFGQGPMGRSYLKATVQLTESTGIDLVTTHLTHKKQNTPTRLDQIDTVLQARPAVLAGDLNFWPSWDEPRSFTQAGYVSAQDVTGHSPEWTSPTNNPTNRVDWIYGTSQVSFSGFAVLDTVTASDHFPLIVTISPR
ncbi:MAG TPA: hypothetical protein DGT23_13865 [Micromonosporaceae bacterium]|nr:hypothetical protein [Micromonosporaceae bacterium]